MADQDKKFFGKANDFFKRIQNQDLISLGDKNINIFNTGQQKEEMKKKQEMQVFRQYLQNKNFNIKHVELFDEYRKMDATFPLINAAIRIYAQETCLSGDTIITTGAGDLTIKELYDSKKNLFYVNSYDRRWNRIEKNECVGVISNGVKPVFKVTVERNIDEDTAILDNIKDTSFKCTDNHKILVNFDKDNNPIFKELKDLKVGDLIFSFYYELDPSCNCKKERFNYTIITNIEPAGEEEVFDLVRVTPNHYFAIKLSKTFYVFVHNCSKDSDGNVIKIISDDKDVKKALEECFYDNLRINSRGYLWARSMMKFGNHFGYLNTRRGVGVTDIVNLPPESIRMFLRPNENTFTDYNYQWYGFGGTGGGGVQFEPWELVHWKIIEDLEYEPYGTSILRSVVDTWRRIVLMREAMVIYRITRAPQRFLFKLDTSGLDPDAALKFADEMKKQLYRKPLINPQTGEIDYKFSAASITEDFYMPTFQGDVGGIEVLEGASNMDAIEDYKIIKDDLYAGLLIPKSFLTEEEDLCLHGDTIILTSEGKKTIKELADFYLTNTKKKIYVLSSNEHGLIVPGKMIRAWETKEVNSLQKITLSNEQVVYCTDNHPFLLESLQYKNAIELETGDLIRNIHNNEITIVSNETINYEDSVKVYDLEVEDYHNFALESEIFVHNSNKAALGQEDVRFGNAVKQYQSYFIDGCLHIALVHLYLNGYGKEDLENFELQMESNSSQAEKSKNELLQQRIDLAKAFLDEGNNGMALMSTTQVLKDVLHFTDEEIARTFQDQFTEKKLIWKLNQLKEQGYYEEPDLEKRKAKLIGLNTDGDNVFKNLKFEASEHLPKVVDILNKKLEAEIGSLTKKNKKHATKKLIEEITDSNIRSNIKRTFVDFSDSKKHLED